MSDDALRLRPISGTLGAEVTGADLRDVHRAIGDRFPRKREVRRCLVDGDRPYFDATVAA